MTEHIHDLMAAYLAGELSPAETALFEAHVRSCQECASELESMRPFWRTLERTFNADTFPGRFSPDFNTAIQKEILRMKEKEQNASKWKSQTRNTILVQVAALLIILVTLGVLITANLTAPKEKAEPENKSAPLVANAPSTAPAPAPAETESAIPDNAASPDADIAASSDREISEAEPEEEETAKASDVPVPEQETRLASALKKLTPAMFEKQNASLVKILKLDEIVIDTVSTGVPEPPQNGSPFSLKVKCTVSPFQPDVRYFFLSLVPDAEKTLSFEVFANGEDTPLKPIGTYSADSKLKVYVVTGPQKKLKLSVTLPGMEKPVRMPVVAKPVPMKDAFPALQMAFVVNSAAVPLVTLNKDIRSELDGIWSELLKSGYDKDPAASAGYEMLSRMQKK